MNSGVHEDGRCRTRSLYETFHVCKGSVHEVREVAICKVGCSDYRRLASALLGESRSPGIRNPDLDGRKPAARRASGSGTRSETVVGMAASTSHEDATTPGQLQEIRSPVAGSLESQVSGWRFFRTSTTCPPETHRRYSVHAVVSHDGAGSRSLPRWHMSTSAATCGAHSLGRRNLGSFLPTPGDKFGEPESVGVRSHLRVACGYGSGHFPVQQDTVLTTKVVDQLGMMRRDHRL